MYIRSPNICWQSNQNLGGSLHSRLAFSAFSDFFDFFRAFRAFGALANISQSAVLSRARHHCLFCTVILSTPHASPVTLYIRSLLSYVLSLPLVYTTSLSLRYSSEQRSSFPSFSRLLEGLPVTRLPAAPLSTFCHRSPGPPPDVTDGREVNLGAPDA